MSQEFETDTPQDSGPRHLTTRRAFVSTFGFGLVSLYGVWAAYGAAPTSLSFISEEATEGMEEGMAGMAGHGGGGMSREEFRKRAEAFYEANKLPDGSVRPRRPDMAAMSEAPEHGMKMEGADGADRAMPMQMASGGHEAKDEDGGKDKHGGMDGPIDVYLMASRYGYEPSVLRLETGVPYRFQFMAVDADHGASINLKLAGHMIRCPAGALVRKELTFTKLDDYLVYCTVYCGEGHDAMMGKIVVA